MKNSLLLFIVIGIPIFLSGCYSMGHRAGVKLYQRTDGKTFIPAGYDGGVVSGYLDEYQRVTEAKEKQERIKKQFEEIEKMDKK